MKRLLPALLFFFVTLSASYSQSLEEVFAIGNKSNCSIADFIVMTPSIIESFPEKTAMPERMRRALSRYSPDLPLTKGRASLLAATGLEVRTSFLFMILPIERYAFQAMAVDGIFSATSSAGDLMTGVDLLDFVSAIGKAYGEAR